MWCGTMHFRVLQEVPYKGEIQLHDAGGGWSQYIQQPDNYNKDMYIEFYSI
jgi:hypothetical protein